MFQATLMIVYRVLPPAQVAGSANMRIRVQQILWRKFFGYLVSAEQRCFLAQFGSSHAPLLKAMQVSNSFALTISALASFVAAPWCCW